MKKTKSNLLVHGLQQLQMFFKIIVGKMNIFKLKQTENPAEEMLPKELSLNYWHGGKTVVDFR